MISPHSWIPSLKTLSWWTAIAVFALLSGYFARSFSRPSGISEQVIGQSRVAFSLPDLDHTAQDIRQWDGRLLLLNFWATWCAPCRQEVPVLVGLQKRYQEQGLQIVGVAIDLPDDIRRFAAEMAINYPLLYGREDALAISRLYGNSSGSLPFTVLLDRQGTIRHLHRGALSLQQAEEWLQQYL